MSFTARTCRALAGAALLLTLGRPSAAQTQPFTFSGDLSDSKVVNISTDSGAHFMSVYAGEYKATLGNGPLINIFCTDATHQIFVGSTYAADTSHKVTDAAGPKTRAKNGSYYYKGGLASALSNSHDFGSTYPTGSANAAARADEIAFLSDSYLNATAATFHNAFSLQDNLAAVSVSIWDIAQNGGDGLTSGTFRANGVNAALVSALETQATHFGTYKSSTAEWIQAPICSNGAHAQDFITKVAGPKISPAPEPSAFAGLALGAAGLGLLAWKRRATA